MVKKDPKIPERLDIHEVTPARAKEWLDTRFDDERPIRPTKVEQFARDMDNDSWHFNGDVIRFDAQTEKLIDGQHRLAAQVKSGTTQWYPIVDLPLEARETIDTGTPRSLGDAIHFDKFGHEVGVGSHVKGRELAALVNRLLRYENNLGTSGGGGAYQPTHAEGLEFFRGNSVALFGALSVAKRVQQSDLPAAPSSLASAYYLCAEVDDDDANTFFIHHVISGLDLAEGHPAKAYRNRLIKYLKNTGNKPPTDDVFRFAIRAWNIWRRGKTSGKLMPPRGGWSRNNLPKPI